MDYNIEIMSQHEVLIKTNNGSLTDAIVISINCPENTTELNKDKVVDLLSLYFHDIEEELEELDNEKLIPISIEDTIKIKNFIVQNKEIKRIVVHCTAGVSRSAGIACALAIFLNGDDFYIRNTNKYMPNNRCFYFLLETLGIELDISEKQKRQDLTNLQIKEGCEKIEKHGYFYKLF